MTSLKLVDALRRGGIAVIPTDTLYGIVARALDKEAVARLYKLRRQTSHKPFIVLVSSLKDLAAFGVRPNATQCVFLKKVWPGPVSVIFRCSSRKSSYLHLGTHSLAFRLPKSRRLVTLLKKTGPLVAPSANREGEKPAETTTEAKEYFGTDVDVYVNGGRRRGEPSTLISFVDEEPRIVRQGAAGIQSL